VFFKRKTKILQECVGKHNSYLQNFYSLSSSTVRTILFCVQADGLFVICFSRSQIAQRFPFRSMSLPFECLEINIFTYLGELEDKISSSDSEELDTLVLSLETSGITSPCQKIALHAVELEKIVNAVVLSSSFGLSDIVVWGICAFIRSSRNSAASHCCI